MADIERIEQNLRIGLDHTPQQTYRVHRSDIRALLSELSRLREREAKAVEVMRPFAREAERISMTHLDGHTSDLDATMVAVAPLRAARAFIAEHDGEGKP